MNANKLRGKSSYFQSGYQDGSSGWRNHPTCNGEKLQEGSYAYSEYEKGYVVGEEDR